MSTSVPERDEQFYSALISAFVQTRMEADKSLLALSSGGIGLTITLMAAFGQPAPIAGVAYGGMVVGFLLTIILILVVFRTNASYIQRTIEVVNAGNDPADDDGVEERKRRLKWLGVAASWSFGLGIAASILLGLTFSLHHPPNASIDVTEKRVIKSFGPDHRAFGEEGPSRSFRTGAAAGP